MEKTSMSSSAMGYQEIKAPHINSGLIARLTAVVSVSSTSFLKWDKDSYY